jgi:DNA uptake protein ComE-like DNA-binding protein
MLKSYLMAVATVVALFGLALGPVSWIETAQAAATAAAPLNPNTATEAQLRAIPQLNAAMVARILRERPYATVGDFNRTVIASMNAEQARLLYGSVFIPINLNTASREDIMLIPMAPRMVREFLEYRPYTSMDQFNREMGKYVDQAEVMRLRGYVTLN